MIVRNRERTYRSKWGGSEALLRSENFPDGNNTPFLAGSAIFWVKGAGGNEESVALNRETVAKLVADLITDFDFTVEIIPATGKTVIVT
jgi:hypothetical protein